MKAILLLDKQNSVSVEYAKITRQMFSPFFDDIEEMQCITPGKINAVPIKFHPKKKRIKAEEAVLASYYILFSKIANGEKFVILEHDAFILEGQESKFASLLETVDICDIWNPGMHVECHTASQRVAKRFCELLQDDMNVRYRGPMEYLQACGVELGDGYFVFPVNAGKPIRDIPKNTLGVGSNIVSCATGKTLTIPAPVTQMIDPSYGSTINFECVKDQREVYTNMEYISLDNYREKS